MTAIRHPEPLAATAIYGFWFLHFGAGAAYGVNYDNPIGVQYPRIFLGSSKPVFMRLEDTFNSWKWKSEKMAKK